MACCGRAGGGNEAVVAEVAAEEGVASGQDGIFLPVRICFREAGNVNLVGGEVLGKVV